jgi:hypothetical protein
MESALLSVGGKCLMLNLVQRFLAYISYFEKNRVGLWDHVAICVYVNPFVSLLGNGWVKIPLSLLGNGLVETLPR